MIASARNVCITTHLVAEKSRFQMKKNHHCNYTLREVFKFKLLRQHNFTRDLKNVIMYFVGYITVFKFKLLCQHNFTWDLKIASLSKYKA